MIEPYGESRSSIRGKTVLGFGIAGLIFAFLFSPLGILFSLVAIILAIIKMRKSYRIKTVIGLVLAVIGLVYASYALISVLSTVLPGITSMNDMGDTIQNSTSEEAIVYCDVKEDLITYTFCTGMLFYYHANHTSIATGQICNNTADMDRNLACVIMGVETLESEEFCSEIPVADDKILCTALVTMNGEMCMEIPDGQRRDECFDAYNQRVREMYR